MSWEVIRDHNMRPPLVCSSNRVTVYLRVGLFISPQTVRVNSFVLLCLYHGKTFSNNQTHLHAEQRCIIFLSIGSQPCVIERQYAAGFHSKPSQQQTMFLMSSSLVLEHWGICWLSTAHQVKMDVGLWTAFAFYILLVGIMKTITFSWMMQPAEGSRYVCVQPKVTCTFKWSFPVGLALLNFTQPPFGCCKINIVLHVTDKNIPFPIEDADFKPDAITAPLKWCYSTITDTVDPPDPAVEFFKIIWDSVSHQTQQGFLFIHIGCPRTHPSFTILRINHLHHGASWWYVCIISGGGEMKIHSRYFSPFDKVADP